MIIPDQDRPEEASSARLGAPLLKAARSLAGLSVDDLARLAQVGVATVKRAESGAKVSHFTEQRLAGGLAKAGVTIIPDGSDGQGPGVRLTSPLSGA